MIYNLACASTGINHKLPFVVFLKLDCNTTRHDPHLYIITIHNKMNNMWHTVMPWNSVRISSISN